MMLVPAELFGQLAIKLMLHIGIPQVVEGAVQGCAKLPWPPLSLDTLQGAAVVADAGGTPSPCHISRTSVVPG